MNSAIDELIAAGEFTHRGRQYPIAYCTPVDICRRYRRLIMDRNAKRILEIGTLFGFSTLFLVDAASQTGGEVDTIDIRYAKRTWSDGQEIEDIHEVAERLVTQAGLDKHVTFHVGNSVSVLAQLLRKQITYDFALIDGSHQFHIALLDFIGVDRMLKVGGYVALDDVGPGVSAKDGLAGGPNRVLTTILATKRYEIELWSPNVTVCQKKKDV